jgi:hypothetical protein
VILLGTKDLKNRKVINISLELSLIEFLKDYSQRTGIPQTRLVDRAVTDLKEKVERGENIYD